MAYKIQLTDIQVNRYGVNNQLLPGVEQLQSHTLKIGCVTRHQNHAMHQRRRRNQGIAFRARIGYVQRCATHRNSRVHRQYSIGKRWQDLGIYPSAQRNARHTILSRQPERTDFDLQNGNYRDMKLCRFKARRPAHNLVLSSMQAPQLRDHIGVEQEQSGKIHRLVQAIAESRRIKFKIFIPRHIEHLANIGAATDQALVVIVPQQYKSWITPISNENGTSFSSTFGTADILVESAAANGRHFH